MRGVRKTVAGPDLRALSRDHPGGATGGGAHDGVVGTTRVMSAVEVAGIPAAVSSRLRIAARVLRTLAPLGEGAQRCRVSFTDENGTKGGRDTTCRITVAIARRIPLSVSARDIAAAPALQKALDRLRRRLERTIRARRQARRRAPRLAMLARTEADATQPASLAP